MKAALQSYIIPTTIICAITLLESMPAHGEAALWDPYGEMNQQAGTLDSYSNECLAWHDHDTDYRISKVSDPGSHLPGSYSFQLSGHPIGANYEDVANGTSLKSRRYRSAQSLDSALFLPDGKVSCITCHEDNDIESNPGQHGQLVMSNRGSNLCLACHDF